MLSGSTATTLRTLVLNPTINAVVLVAFDFSGAIAILTINPLTNRLQRPTETLVQSLFNFAFVACVLTLWAGDHASSPT
jgi:hypothetical protein